MIETTNWSFMKPEEGETDMAPDWAKTLDDIDGALLTPTQKTDLTDAGDTALHHHDTHNDGRYSQLAHVHVGVYAPLAHVHSGADVTSGTVGEAYLPVGIGTSKVAQVRAGTWTASGEVAYPAGWQNINVGGGGYFALGSCGIGDVLTMGGSLRALAGRVISIGFMVTNGATVLRQFTVAFGADSVSSSQFYQFAAPAADARLYVRVYSAAGCTLDAVGSVTEERYCNAGYTLFSAT